MVDVNGYPDTYKGCKIKVIHLASDIVVMAKQGYDGRDWAAYMGCIACAKHRMSKTLSPEETVEWIMEHGSKVDYKIAAYIFPSFDKEYGWRP